MSCLNCPNLYALPFSNTVYTLNAIDEDGCIAKDSITIDVIFAQRVFAPNVFSPNSDGINDYFYLLSDKGVKEILEFKVFGRWGQLIFETSNIPPNIPILGWDDTFKSKKMNPNVFVWMAEVEFLNGKREILKGDMLLIR
ncbi:MAG: gliding motility-associated-like protein [Paraglaciecola sp.]